MPRRVYCGNECCFTRWHTQNTFGLSRQMKEAANFAAETDAELPSSFSEH